MLQRKHRLTYNDIQALRVGASHKHTQFFSLKFKTIPEGEDSKVSIVVPKKVLSKAVYRNKLKRRCYEVVKQFFSTKHSPFHALVYVKKGSEKLSFLELQSALNEALSTTQK